MSADADFITIVRARGRRLAKLIRADGHSEGYDSAKHVDLAERSLSGLTDLVELLSALRTRPDCCVVRGAIIDLNRTQRVRRLVYPDRETGEAPTLREEPHRWIPLDFDSVPCPAEVPPADLARCGAVVIARLPEAFGQADCIIQATANHGIKPGCRLRLWYWADRSLSGAELKTWLRSAPVDPTVFRAAQPIYTAAPVFAPGATDRLPLRLVFLSRRGNVPAPPPEVLAPPPQRSPPPRRPIHPGDSRAERMLERALYRVRTAREGNRHPTLVDASLTIGHMLRDLDISADRAEEELFDAVHAAGGTAVDERNARATIRWGLEHGNA